MLDHLLASLHISVDPMIRVLAMLYHHPKNPMLPATPRMQKRSLHPQNQYKIFQRRLYPNNQNQEKRSLRTMLQRLRG